MAREVAERIDCAVAPKGFMRSIVSKEKQHLFYWDNSYLTDFFQRKRNAFIPGSNYFSKLEAFSKKHIIVGEKYLEFVKFACADGMNGTPCSHCLEDGLVNEAFRRIPEPMPDARSGNFQYLHIKKTPTEIDGVRRAVNHFNPKVQLKKWFEQGYLRTDHPETISAFAEKFIVDDIIVKAAIT